LFKDYGGSHSASVIRIDSIAVNDGNLDLRFINQKDNPKISGIYLSRQKNITDPDLPAIVNLTDKVLEAYTAWNYQVEVSNAQPGDVWFSAEGLPGNLTLDPFTGIISGQVGIINKTPVTVKIRDKSGNISTATFNITASTWEELRINAGGKAMVIGNEQ